MNNPDWGNKPVFIRNPHSTLPREVPIVDDDQLEPWQLIVRTEKHDVLIDFKANKATRIKRPTFEPLPGYGNLIPWARFRKLVKEGGIDDYDGSGSLATATTVSDIGIAPSRVRRTPPFPWATHVHWCNK